MATPTDPLGRRHFLAAGAGALVWAATGCSDDTGATPDPLSSNPTSTSLSAPSTPPPSSTTPTAPPTPAAEPVVPSDFAASSTCLLLPEMAAGPFPTIEQLDRRDITEGYPGRPLQLGLRVVGESCEPMPGVAVEVWHTDATGDYSSYADGGTGKDEGSDTTFLRGRQTADGDGIVEFATIYPGWYPGRAVHIHVRVHRGDELVLTSQLFFPDEASREVFATGPYAEFGPPDTTNATDGLGGDVSGNGSLVTLATLGNGSEPPLRALLNLGIRT